MCFSAENGKFLWQAVHEKLPGKEAEDWPFTGLPTTPCVYGDLVYYVSNRAELVCRAVQDGKLVWILDMKKDLGVQPFQASAGSPLVVGDLVFVGTGNSLDAKTSKVKNPQAPSFVAVERKSGKLAWKDNSPGNKIVWGSWGSLPIPPWTDGLRLCFPERMAGFIPSIRPAENRFGSSTASLMRSRWRRERNRPTSSCRPRRCSRGTASLFPWGADPDTNDKGCLWAVDARKDGDVTSSAELWRIPGDAFGLSISSVAVQDGLVYAVEQQGFLNCVDLETGKVVWKHDFLSSLHGAPLIADEKIFVLNGDGEVFVLQAGREKKILAKNDKFKHLESGSLVVANGVLYFTGRSETSGAGKLYAVAGGK